MLIPLGILATAGAGAIVSGAFDLISSATGTGSSGTITFSSIPSTYKHLQVRGVVQPSTSVGMNLRLNGITTSSYGWHALRGSGSTVVAQSATGTNIQTGEALSATTGVTNPYIIDILDYASTSKNKTVRLVYGVPDSSSGYWVGLTGGILSNTAAINSITLELGSFNFTSGTRLALYGIKG